jgi:16S rRNA (uracil1498-N3)-methyltransferase
LARVARVPLTGLEAGERELDSKTLHYLRDVLRLRAGEPFIAFDPAAQLEADAELAGASTTRCALGVPRAAPRVASSGIVLVQALGKGDKTEQVVRSATALGVAELHLVESARSVARLGDAERNDGKRARLESVALDAARQSGRGDVPQIVGPHSLERELASFRQRDGIKLCLVPGALHTLQSLTRSWLYGSPIALLIGPEGGLSAEEITAAEHAGFVPTRFGELVLRTEIAGIAALGALLLLGEP